MILTGTSGFSFKDWQGVFYPENIKSSDWLQYYNKFFDVLEINSTYYGIPKPSVFDNMVKRTNDNFQFFVKVNKLTTHENSDDEVRAKLIDSIAPLKEAGKFSGFLAQFPWSFRNDEKNRHYLSNLADDYKGMNLYVEFRHKSWNEESIFDFLKHNNLLFVSVDEPSMGEMMPPVAKATGDSGYIRFHGRNKDTWWGNSGDRYDYSYSEKELEEWIDKVEAIEKTVWKIYAFFNNCHKGYAVRNALMFMEMSKRKGLS